MAALNQFTYTLPGTIEAGFVTVFKAADFRSEMLDGGANGFTAECGNGQAYTDDGLGTRIPIDVVTCVVGGVPDVEIHVRHPTGGTGATIHWVADDTQTVQPIASALYGSEEVWQDWQAMLHLNETPNNDAEGYRDSTGNGFNGTGVSMSLSGAGPMAGSANYFDDIADYISLPFGAWGSSPTAMTVQAWAKCDDLVDDQRLFAAQNSDDSDQLVVWMDAGGAGKGWRTFSRNSAADGFAPVPDSQNDATTSWQKISASLSSSGTSKVYVDGSESGSVAFTGSLPTSITGTMQIARRGSDPAGAGYFGGGVYGFGYRLDQLSPGYESAQYDNQSSVTAWGTVGPLIPAGGAATVEVPVGSIALTGYAPSIQSGYSVTVPAASIALTGYVPTVSTGAGLDIEIPSGSIALTGYAPVIGIGATVSPSLGSITLSGYAPDVVVGGGVSVTPGIAAIGLTGYAPVVSAGSALTIAVPTGSVTLTGYAPNVATVDSLDSIFSVLTPISASGSSAYSMINTRPTSVQCSIESTISLLSSIDGNGNGVYSAITSAGVSVSSSI